MVEWWPAVPLLQNEDTSNLFFIVHVNTALNKSTAALWTSLTSYELTLQFRSICTYLFLTSPTFEGEMYLLYKTRDLACGKRRREKFLALHKAGKRFSVSWKVRQSSDLKGVSASAQLAQHKVAHNGFGIIPENLRFSFHFLKLSSCRLFLKHNVAQFQIFLQSATFPLNRYSSWDSSALKHVATCLS